MSAEILHTVYLHRSAAGRVLYVGCTKDLKKRTASHGAAAYYASMWWPYVATVEVDSLWPDRTKALARERALIAEFLPPGNRQHNPTGHYGLHCEFEAIVELLDGDRSKALALISNRATREVWAELVFADAAVA